MISEYVNTGVEEVDTAAGEWVMGIFFVLVLCAVYLGVYYFAICPCVPAASRDHFLRELLKDTATYAFLAVFLVSGMHRYAARARALQGMNKWIAFAIFGVFACLLGVLALALDMFVASNIEIFGARGYPERWQRDLIVAHIYLRDWLLLVPLSILVFARLLLRVSQPSGKSRGRGKRAGVAPSSANAQR